MPSAVARPPRRRASSRIRTSGIRWDRLSRVALLALLGGILLMYVSPAKHWWESSRTAAAQSEELSHLEAENKRLKQLVADLTLDKTMLQILRAGAYELLARPDVPVGAAISEWVDVAKAFFDDREAKFVNGVLDAVAKDAR